MKCNLINLILVLNCEKNFIFYINSIIKNYILYILLTIAKKDIVIVYKNRYSSFSYIYHTIIILYYIRGFTALFKIYIKFYSKSKIIKSILGLT